MKKQNILCPIILILIVGLSYYLIPNNMNAEINIEKDTYKIGEEIKVEVSLENNGFKTIKKKYTNACEMTFIYVRILNLKDPNDFSSICSQPTGVYKLKPGEKEIKEFEFQTEGNKPGFYIVVIEVSGNKIKREIQLEN